jgi:hypothetical protein
LDEAGNKAYGKIFMLNPEGVIFEFAYLSRWAS